MMRMNSTIMVLQVFLWMCVALSLFDKLAAEEGVALPSSWIIVEPLEDRRRPMGMSFMTCTWSWKDQKLTDCDKTSYGGVTNFDIDNISLMNSDHVMLIPFVTSFRRVPNCKANRLLIGGDFDKSIVVNLFTMYVVESGIELLGAAKWSNTTIPTALNVRFSVYCYSAIPGFASKSLVQRDSSEARVSLPSTWLIVDPVADTLTALGISLLVCGEWIGGKQILEKCDPNYTYGGVANMEPSLAEVIPQNGYDLLYIPFTIPYSKPPVCIGESFMNLIAPLVSVNGVYLGLYFGASDIISWTLENHRFFSITCIGGIRSEDSTKTPDQVVNADSMPFIGLPSLWTVINGNDDVSLAMGASFMSCTWNATDHTLICNSEQSYGGVANLDVKNFQLEFGERTLKVSFFKSYAKEPHCFQSENQLENEKKMKLLFIVVTRDAVSFLRYADDGSYISWLSNVHSGFTVLCFGAMAWSA